MPSQPYRVWLTTRAKALDEIESAHRSVGGTGPGRRYATQQINQAYAVLLSSHLQALCRDLHTECANHLVAPVASPHLRETYRSGFVMNRKLDLGDRSRPHE